MSLIQLIILAIVEGVTEFLPISSTGHLILFSKFMNVPSDVFTKVFTVSIQFGAILSVIVLYGKRFFSTFLFYKKLLIAFIPAVVAGLLLGHIVDQLLENVWVVAISLIVGGIILLFIDRIFKENQKTEPSYLNALVIGLFQCIALIPGISRSAATIVGGLTQKLSKKAAAEFSFFLAVPTMFAASCYIIYKNYHLIQPHDVYPLLLGNAVSFIVALLAIRFFIQLVQRYSFAIFGYYRIIVGTVILVLLALGIKLEVV